MTTGRKFPQELDTACRVRRKELGRDLTAEEVAHVEGVLFEAWVDAGRYDELIRRIHHVYDVEGGSEECAVLGYYLRAAKDAERIRTLFEGLLTRREKAFRASWAQAQSGHIGHMLLAAQRLVSIMEAGNEYFLSLAALGLTEESEALRARLMALQARAVA